MADERLWYPLDGTWHKSVASRLSVLHLPSPDPHTKGCSLCEPMTKVLYMADQYTEKEAERAGRTLCKRCLSHVPSTNANRK